jgi:hypothetical protein
MIDFRLLQNRSGAIPIVLIWAIVIACLLGGGAGVLGYFATHAVSGLLVFVACGVIFVLIILPNSQAIIKWTKGTIYEIRKKNT